MLTDDGHNRLPVHNKSKNINTNAKTTKLHNEKQVEIKEAKPKLTHI